MTINANKTVTVENRVNGGQLEISKTNIGGDPNDVFDFSVNINGTLYNGEYKLRSGGTTTTKSMTNGKLQLKGGERAVIAVSYTHLRRIQRQLW